MQVMQCLVSAFLIGGVSVRYFILFIGIEYAAFYFGFWCAFALQ